VAGQGILVGSLFEFASQHAAMKNRRGKMIENTAPKGSNILKTMSINSATFCYILL